MGLFNWKKEEVVDAGMVSNMAMMLVIGAALVEKSFESSHVTLFFENNISFSLNEDSGTESFVRGLRDTSSEETKKYNINSRGTFPCTVEMYQQFKRAINPSKIDSEGIQVSTLIMNSNAKKSKNYYEAVVAELKSFLSPSQIAKFSFNGSSISFRKSSY